MLPVQRAAVGDDLGDAAAGGDLGKGATGDDLSEGVAAGVELSEAASAAVGALK